MTLPDPRRFDQALAESREILAIWAQNMPREVDVAAIGVKQKTPYKALCVREALIWRTEELGRNACDALERSDDAAACLLTRAVIESAALIWRLMDFLERRREFTRDELDDKIHAMLMGHRNVEGMPQAVGISQHIERLDKAVPGVSAAYAGLSEVAHPNWSGVNGLYSRIDHERFITFFGREMRPMLSQRVSTAITLAATLKVFHHAYNQLSDLMPTYIAEFDPL